MGTDIATARRLERGDWINVRTVLGTLLFLVAVLGGRQLLESAATTTPVWVAAEDLPADHIVEPSDLSLAEVNLPGTQLNTYALASTPVEGAIVTRPLAAGEMVPVAALVEPGSVTASRAITIPIAAEHAVGGDLRPGDRVDVLATFDARDVGARTVLLARSVDVAGIVTAGGLVGDEASVGVTVVVSPEEAARLAFAIRAAEIDLVRVIATPDAATPEIVRGADFR